jgi:Gpi18-like mannosyltransferase
MFTFVIWVIFRITTSLFSSLTSSIRPVTPLEISIPIFPPSSPIFLWMQRVFISPWMRWDAFWYQRIVAQGYSISDGTAQFHPLFPWLAIPLVKAGFSAPLSLLIISSASGILLFMILHRLMLLDMSKKDAFWGLLLFASTPVSFILFAPYPEALFLLFAVLCLFWSRKKKWWLAGIAGGLAALTRQQGIFLLFPMAWELWEDSGRNFYDMRIKWRYGIALSLIPFGMVIWLGYREVFLRDVQPDFSTIHTFIYSFLISPSASQVVHIQQFLWPWHAFYLSIQKIITQPDIDIWVNIILGLLFLIAFALTWRKMRLSYRIYALVIALVSFSFYTGPIHPYMGLPRHLLLAFPIIFTLTQVVKKSSLRLLGLSFSFLGLIFLLILYTLNSWVP